MWTTRLASSSFIGVVGAMMILSSCTEASGGAESGEFLGYRIGSRYPMTSSTKLSHWHEASAYILEAESPVKPTEFGPVYLVVTKKTYTILAITSSKDFPSRAQQLEFANKYLGVLSAQYPAARRDGPAQLDDSDTGRGLDFGPEDPQKKGFWLFVDLYKRNPRSSFSGQFPVHIGLTWRAGNWDLYNQAMKESAERDREDAAKKGLNRGL